jgi:hypothetical protein
VRRPAALPGPGPVAASDQCQTNWGNWGKAIFAISASDGGIYVYLQGHWQVVDNSTTFANLSATRNGTLFATTNSGKLYEESPYQPLSHDPLGWWHQDISGGHTFSNAQGQLSADLDASGNPEVYAVDQSGNAWLYDQGSWTWKDSNVVNIAGADAGYFYEGYQYGTSTPSMWQYDPTNPYLWTYLGSNVY